jgi:hypothetical protein
LSSLPARDLLACGRELVRCRGGAGSRVLADLLEPLLVRSQLVELAARAEQRLAQARKLAVVGRYPGARVLEIGERGRDPLIALLKLGPLLVEMAPHVVRGLRAFREPIAVIVERGFALRESAAMLIERSIALCNLFSQLPEVGFVRGQELALFRDLAVALVDRVAQRHRGRRGVLAILVERGA